MPQTLLQILNDEEPVQREAPDQAGYRELFADLQANILTPHGFDCSRYFLLSFDRDKKKLRALKLLISALSTPGEYPLESGGNSGVAQGSVALGQQLAALRVIPEHDIYARRGAERSAKARRTSSRALVEQERPQHASGAAYTVNVMLSATGYQAFELQAPDDSAFRSGMARQASRLGDRPDRFEDWYREHVIDALVIVSYDEQAPDPPATLEQLKAALDACTASVHCESGKVLRAVPAAPNEPPYAIEPFGYRDAISQPIFYEEHRDYLAQRGRISPRRDQPTRFEATAPLGLALVPDLAGLRSGRAYACGSYFVFRKLKQHVAKFYEATDQIANQHGLDAELVRNRLIGRKPDGTPLVDGSPGRGGDDNAFDFSNDLEGQRCPFSAHVRKLNPRSDVNPIYAAGDSRIVRRAMSYGPELAREPGGAPRRPLSHAQDVGLLFLCAQANIGQQFEHLQASWANPYDHLRGKPTGVDPIIGQVPNGVEKTIRFHPDDPSQTAPFPELVELKGGEYFFAPSIGFLQQLGASTD